MNSPAPRSSRLFREHTVSTWVPTYLGMYGTAVIVMQLRWWRRVRKEQSSLAVVVVEEGARHPHPRVPEFRHVHIV